MLAWTFCIVGVGFIVGGVLMQHGPKNALILFGVLVLLLAMGSFMRGSKPLGRSDDDEN